MMKQISFAFSENNNKQINKIKSLFTDGSVEKIRKKIQIEGIKIPIEQYSLNNQCNYTSEKFKDFLFAKKQSTKSNLKKEKVFTKAQSKELLVYKQFGNLKFYTNCQLVRNASKQFTSKDKVLEQNLSKILQKEKRKAQFKEILKKKTQFLFHRNLLQYLQQKTRKVLSSEPVTLLDSLESKRERKKKGRWNKRDENDISSDEGYQQIIESSEEDNEEEEEESGLKIIFPKFNNIIKFYSNLLFIYKRVNDLPQPFSLMQFKFYPKVIYDMHYNISITKLPKHKQQEQLLDNLVWVIEDFYNFAQIALETQNNFEVMSEKLGKTHYDIRILHEFIDKAPIKLNDYTREWRRKKANKTEIIQSAKANIKSALKTIFCNFTDEKKIYEPSFPFDQRIVSLKQLALALRRYQYEYSYEKGKIKK